MRGLHLHVDQLSGSSRELAGAREHFAGQPWEVLTGGSGVVSAPPNGNAAIVSPGADANAHHGVVGLVLFAVIVLFLLDRAGFRFAVTAGRR